MAPGSVTSDIPRILKTALNLPIQIVEGYKGTAEIRVAADSGEVDGGCWGWETMKIMWRQGLEAGDAKVLIQALPRNTRTFRMCPMLSTSPRPMILGS